MDGTLGVESKAMFQTRTFWSTIADRGRKPMTLPADSETLSCMLLRWEKGLVLFCWTRH